MKIELNKNEIAAVTGGGGGNIIISLFTLLGGAAVVAWLYILNRNGKHRYANCCFVTSLTITFAFVGALIGARKDKYNEEQHALVEKQKLS